jgi:nucleolin
LLFALLINHGRFGYVEFTSVAEAERAIESLNQQPFQGRRLAVQFHKPREPINKRHFEDGPRRINPPSKTLFIGNMSFDMSDKDLNDLFREIKNVVDVRVAVDRRTGQPRGFAHCDLLDVESATKAKEILANKEVHGRRLRVDYSFSAADRTDRAPRERNENRAPREHTEN